MIPSQRFAQKQSAEANYFEKEPLFERMETNMDLELHQCKETIDSMRSRMKRLEDMNLELEYRLQDQGRQCMAAEKECFDIRKEWSAKCKVLEAEINKWKGECQTQQQKTEKMKDQLSRTERELYGILQKKYDFMRNQGNQGNQGSSSSNQSQSSVKSAERQTSGSFQNMNEVTSGDQEGNDNEGPTTQEIQQRNIAMTLADFLGI